MLLKIYKKCEKWPEAMPKFMIVAYNSGEEESSDSDVNIPVMPMTSIKVWMFTRHCQWVTSKFNDSENDKNNANKRIR